MSHKRYNPIREKLDLLIKSGKVTKEKICVAADLKYPTLDNVWKRPRISYYTLRALKDAGIVSKREEQDYLIWLENKGKKNNEKTSLDNIKELGNED